MSIKIFCVAGMSNKLQFVAASQQRYSDREAQQTEVCLRLLSSASYDRLTQRSPVIIIFQRLLFAYVTSTNSR